MTFVRRFGRNDARLREVFEEIDRDERAKSACPECGKPKMGVTFKNAYGRMQTLREAGLCECAVAVALVWIPRSKVLHSAEMRVVSGGQMRAPVTHCSKVVPLRATQLEYSPELDDRICRVCKRTHGFRRMLAARAQRSEATS